MNPPMKSIERKILYLLVILMLSSFASAGIGVARDVLPENILKLHLGESTWYGMRIQNPTDSNLTVGVSMKGGENIVTIMGLKPSYTIPANTYDTEIKLNISIPYSAPIGETHNITILVGQVATGGGTVPLSGAVSFTIKVKVVGDLENGTYISRRNLSDQQIPCVTSRDCPPNNECRQWICVPLPPVNEVVIPPTDYLPLLILAVILTFLSVIVFLAKTDRLYFISETITEIMDRTHITEILDRIR